jgi:putative nucleotidyltransferase with HDIG domain
MNCDLTYPDIRHRLLSAKLPAMPQLLLKVMEKCQSEEVGLSDLGELIGQDAAMTAKILRAASSSAYRRGSRPVGLERALLSMGINMVKTLLISESILQVLDKLTRSYVFNLGEFWKHSVSTGMIARQIAKRMNYPHLEEAYLAGLLHDIGRPALLAVASEDDATVPVEPDSARLCAIEQSIFGVSHSQAGAWIIEHWEVDSFIADSVLYHHAPVTRLAGTHPLIRIVCLADLLSSDNGNERDITAAAKLCNLADNDLSLIKTKAAEELAEVAVYLGIDLDSPEDGHGVAESAQSGKKQKKQGRDAIDKKLGHEMQNLLLASEVERSFGRERQLAESVDAISMTARWARILFDFSEVVILRADQEKQTLDATTSTTAEKYHQRLSHFSIPFSDDGPVATALREQLVCHVSRHETVLGIPEEQLFRFLGSEHMVCVPLAGHTGCAGMLIGAVTGTQLDQSRHRTGFFQAFGAQAADALAPAKQSRRGVHHDMASTTSDFREVSRRMAHEVNNPLSIIRNYLAVMDSKLGRQEKIDSEISIIQEEIDRVSALLHKFVDTPAEPEKETTELNDTIHAVVRFFNTMKYVPPSVNLVARVRAQSAEVACGTGALKQIFINLIKNAIEALHEVAGGGDIEIVNNGFVHRHGRLYAEVLISDTGKGIPMDVMEKLFSPTQSTKGGDHKGLGLNIVHTLVSQAEGQISCRSNTQGTTFEILLPISDADQPGRPSGSQVPVSIPGREDNGQIDAK